MKAESWIGILYYVIGKQQTTNLQTQASFLNNKGEKIFLKRKYYLDEVGRTLENKKPKHRTILKNEIIIDLDEDPKIITPLKTIAKNIHLKLKEENTKHAVYFTGSKGYHIHIYDNEMLWMDYEQRKQHRTKTCKKFLTNYDPLVCNENHMIAIEFENHWKTGKPKTPIHDHNLLKQFNIEV